MLKNIQLTYKVTKLVNRVLFNFSIYQVSQLHVNYMKCAK
jgi:hypothetical protein